MNRSNVAAIKVLVTHVITGAANAVDEQGCCKNWQQHHAVSKFQIGSTTIHAFLFKNCFIVASGVDRLVGFRIREHIDQPFRMLFRNRWEARDVLHLFTDR